MSGRETTTVDGVRWELSAPGRAVLSVVDLRLDEHIKSSRATVIKHGEHRTVYRIPLKSATVYWKYCRLSGPRAWWRDLLRGPKAKLEYDRLEELARRGIATVQPLAWGRYDTAWPKGSFLITQSLDDAIPLDHYLSEHPPATMSARRRLTVALANYISTLHAAGVSHPDFHPGNLLIREEAGEPRFFLIDVHDVRCSKPLASGERLANLTLLNRWFRLRVSRTDRLRFWRAYAGSDWSRDDARKLERQTDRSVTQLWESRDGRCLRENRHFRRIRGDGVDGFCERQLDQPFVTELLTDPDAIFGSPDISTLKDSRSSSVIALEVSTEAGPLGMVYKRFRVTNWYDPLVNLFRPSPAVRAWKNGHAMLARGLPTPRPLLLLQRRLLGLATVGYVLFERIDGAKDLHELVAAADSRSLRQIGDLLARRIRLMHERGMSHRDLKAANILVTADGGCQFLDLAGVQIHRRVNHRIRVRDLMRLNASFLKSTAVTRTTRLRFLRTYLIWGLRGREGWKSWWKEVERATQEKVRQNERRNRPLA
jgi:tRNA A-37 threonylcarbamoyl transferase component Bud32